MDAKQMRRWGTVGAAGTVLGYAVPSVTALSAVRRCTPRLAGLGRPDHVALTFDDGPDPLGTPAILDILAEFGITATFFVLGRQVAAHRGVARRLTAEGHEIGLHGWHHRNSLFVSPRSLRNSLRRAVDEISDTTGVVPVLYRPPYGISTAATFWAARGLGLTPVLWGAWGKDWSARATPETVLRTLRGQVRGGCTVLLHDSDCTSAPGSWRATAGALRPLVRGLTAQGLTVGPLRDHAVGQTQLREHVGEPGAEFLGGVLRRGDRSAVDRG
jgi:peptidoglycan/xylan/chitin deacetylase (PgdA/CDA1 family)